MRVNFRPATASNGDLYRHAISVLMELDANLSEWGGSPSQRMMVARIRRCLTELELRGTQLSLADGLGD